MLLVDMMVNQTLVKMLNFCIQTEHFGANYLICPTAGMYLLRMENMLVVVETAIVSADQHATPWDVMDGNGKLICRLLEVDMSPGPGLMVRFS